MITAMVAKAVERAVDTMHHSLSEMILEGQAKVTKQVGADLDALAGRLEGRVQRTREFHESLINSMKNDQVKFQAELRSTITGVQVTQGQLSQKPEGSVNQMGFSPNSVVAMIGSETLGQPLGGRQVEGVVDNYSMVEVLGELEVMAGCVEQMAGVEQEAIIWEETMVDGVTEN